MQPSDDPLNPFTPPDAAPRRKLKWGWKRTASALLGVFVYAVAPALVLTALFELTSPFPESSQYALVGVLLLVAVLFYSYIFTCRDLPRVLLQHPEDAPWAPVPPRDVSAAEAQEILDDAQGSDFDPSPHDDLAPPVDGVELDHDIPDWPHVVEDYLSACDPDGAFQHVLRPGVPLAEVQRMEQQLGFELPDELRSLYQSVNGFGLGLPDEDLPLMLVPLEALPPFIAQTRSVFAASHPDYSAAFLPIFHFNDRDAAGYLFNEDGASIHACLFFFHADSYTGSSNQDVDEFLSSFSYGLLEFMSPSGRS